MHPIISKRKHEFLSGLASDRFDDLVQACKPEIAQYRSRLKQFGRSEVPEEHASEILVWIRAEVLSGKYRGFKNYKTNCATVADDASVKHLVAQFNASAAAQNYFKRLEKLLNGESKALEVLKTEATIAESLRDCKHEQSDAQLDWVILGHIARWLGGAKKQALELDVVYEAFALDAAGQRKFAKIHEEQKSLPRGTRSTNRAKALKALEIALEPRFIQIFGRRPSKAA